MRSKGWMVVIVCAIGGIPTSEASSINATVGGDPTTPITVGTGINQATMAIEFGDGAFFEFNVLFGSAPADTINGLAMFDIIEAETDLATERLVFPFGTAIDGISFMGSSNQGFGGGENFWHYWVREDATEPWTFAATGPGDRTVGDGSFDGWVYGNAYPPGEIPEPAALGNLLIAAGLYVGRRR